MARIIQSPLKSGFFTEISTDGPEPTARAFPSLAVVDNAGYEDVYLFGGGTFPFDLPFPSSDKFWRCDSATDSWTDLSLLGINRLGSRGRKVQTVPLPV